ncbi:DnaD domain protein [Bacillus sp. JJ864]|uniref:DnaD domain-containing protein n=1 Tax=Bacillus sp. JJ864 TaxID=3122975 RepID=UPI002FFDC793
MAVYRNIQITFWQDSFVLDLTPEEKYFYLYLMTNNKTSQSGIYEIPLRVIEMDTGYNRETVEKLLERFAEYGKINYNKRTKEIMILNWLKYNPVSNINIEKCILKELELIKDEEFLLDFYENCLELERTKGYKIGLIKEHFQRRFKELERGFETPMKKKEKEEEKEQEKEQEEEADEVVEVNPISFYEQNFSVSISPFIAEEILQWVDDLNSGLVIKAMKIALEKNIKHMTYVNSILRDWHDKGFRTVEEVEAADKEFRAKRVTQMQKQPVYQQAVMSQATKQVLQQQESWQQNAPTDEELAALNKQNGWMMQ